MTTLRGTPAPSEDVVPEPEPKPRPKPKPKQAAIFALCIEIFSHNSYDARQQGCFQHRNALRPVESLLEHCHPLTVQIFDEAFVNIKDIFSSTSI